LHGRPQGQCLQLRSLKTFRHSYRLTGICSLTQVTVTSELKAAVAPRPQFCNWIHSGLIDHQLLLISDKAYFPLNAYVIYMNLEWLKDLSKMCWCVVSARKIIGALSSMKPWPQSNV
jgi:hypothetical protein